VSEEVVVDTNVWRLADKRPKDISLDDVDCVAACKDFLSTLETDKHTLAVDMSFVILGEYRDNLKRGGFGYELLSRLELQWMKRIVFADVQSAHDDHSLFCSGGPLCGFHDDDRKFVMVAIQTDPHRPIYNATDRDWSEHSKGFETAEIEVRELCPCVVARPRRRG
jgi:hypothetical protein